MTQTAVEYVRETSARMTDRYLGDCLVHARRIAELLEAEGQSPWIARIHEEVETDQELFEAHQGDCRSLIALYPPQWHFLTNLAPQAAVPFFGTFRW